MLTESTEVLGSSNGAKIDLFLGVPLLGVLSVVF